MKREYQILSILGLIIIASGVLIGISGSKKSPSTGQMDPESQASQSNEMGMPEVNTGEILSNIAEMKKELSANPNNHDILIKLGNDYYDIDSASQAIEYYGRALKINPDDPPVLVDCGAMYRVLGETDKAIEMFNRAIELNPKLSQAFLNLGMVLHMEKKDMPGAIKAWKKYMELEPNSPVKTILEDEIAKAEKNL